MSKYYSLINGSRGDLTRDDFSSPGSFTTLPSHIDILLQLVITIVLPLPIILIPFKIIPPFPQTSTGQVMDSNSDDTDHLLLHVNDEVENRPNCKLRVVNLSKCSDKRVQILNEVAMEVPEAVVVGLIGPSGGGKSTLLRALNRLWEPGRGCVLLDGVDICDMDVLSLRRKVGMLFQLPVLFEGTVADNVRYGPRLHGKTLTDEDVARLLSMADIDPSFASKNSGQLSVGQAQRVALARTLANNPEVLLLDEPTSALDPISTQNIEEVIMKLKEEGMTTLMVSHSVKQIQRIADIVCLLVDGHVVEVLKPDQLSEAQHPMARRFLELS